MKYLNYFLFDGNNVTLNAIRKSAFESANTLSRSQNKLLDIKKKNLIIYSDSFVFQKR
jgi:hypothetical protein